MAKRTRKAASSESDQQPGLNLTVDVIEELEDSLRDPALDPKDRTRILLTLLPYLAAKKQTATTDDKVINITILDYKSYNPESEQQEQPSQLKLID